MCICADVFICVCVRACAEVLVHGPESGAIMLSQLIVLHLYYVYLLMHVYLYSFYIHLLKSTFVTVKLPQITTDQRNCRTQR